MTGSPEILLFSAALCCLHGKFITQQPKGTRPNTRIRSSAATVINYSKVHYLVFCTLICNHTHKRNQNQLNLWNGNTFLIYFLFHFLSEESERIALIHHFSHAFSGFSAMLTESEASALSGIFLSLSSTPFPFCLHQIFNLHDSLTFLMFCCQFTFLFCGHYYLGLITRKKSINFTIWFFFSKQNQYR